MVEHRLADHVFLGADQADIRYWNGLPFIEQAPGLDHVVHDFALGQALGSGPRMRRQCDHRGGPRPVDAVGTNSRALLDELLPGKRGEVQWRFEQKSGACGFGRRDGAWRVGAGGGWGMGLGGGFCLRCRKSRGYEEQAGQGEPSCEGMERCHDVADSSIGVVAGW